mgnify:CR=1 FL=1
MAKNSQKGTVVLNLDNGVELYCNKIKFFTIQSKKLLILVYSPEKKDMVSMQNEKMNIPISCMIIIKKKMGKED